jgi:hypothetical protein
MKLCELSASLTCVVPCVLNVIGVLQLLNLSALKFPRIIFIIRIFQYSGTGKSVTAENQSSNPLVNLLYYIVLTCSIFCCLVTGFGFTDRICMYVHFWLHMTSRTSSKRTLTTCLLVPGTSHRCNRNSRVQSIRIQYTALSDREWGKFNRN